LCLQEESEGDEYEGEGIEDEDEDELVEEEEDGEDEDGEDGGWLVASHSTGAYCRLGRISCAVRCAVLAVQALQGS
jgi:hypothetical protein